MATEQRVSRLEGAYEQVDSRLDSMDRRLDSVDRRLDSMDQSMNSLRSEINSRFNTLYVLIGASWVTVVGAIIGLYFR